MVPARASSRLPGLLVLGLALLTQPAAAAEFEARFAEAEALRVEAADLGAEWIETERLLDDARDAADRGDTDAAMALVEKAEFQAEAAIRQAKQEAEAWKERVIRKTE